MNSVNLIGNLTRAADLKELPNTTVTNFTVAVRNPFSPDNTDFVRCVAFGKTAEIIAKYTDKGSKVAVEGRIQVRNFEDNEGNKRQSTEVVVNQVHLLDAKKDTTQRPQDPSPVIVDGEDELPF